MIRMISGTIAAQHGQGVVVDVSGVGYLVHTAIHDRPSIGTKVRFLTHLSVRETALDLYGFQAESDLKMFELLLTVPKIGPKSALQILDQASVSLLIEAVHLEDPGHLSKLSGIGKKTAENIVLGLKSKLDDHFDTSIQSTTSNTNQDAFDALVALGYAPATVRDVLQRIPNDVDTQGQIRAALQELS